MPFNRIIDIKRVEGSVTEPVTLAQVKAHLIITSTDDDTLLTSLISQCRKSIEDYCAVSVVAKTVTLTADINREWELPYGPVTGIQSVSTRNGNEGSGPATYSSQATGWTTDGQEFISFNPTKFGYDPQFNWYPPERNPPPFTNRYKLIYTTGYSPVPDELKLAILNEIAFRYEHRGEEVIGVSILAQSLAYPFKRDLWF